MAAVSATRAAIRNAPSGRRGTEDGDDAREYLERLGQAATIPLKKDVARLLILKDRYGADALSIAIQQALRHNALGAASVEKPLYLGTFRMAFGPSQKA